MACYNRMKAKSRKQEIADRKAEIAAVEDGTWPRDIDDEMRWGSTKTFHDMAEKARYAKDMCNGVLVYMEDLQDRLNAGGDPCLNGWEV